MERSMFLGSMCQGGLVPALVRAPLPQVHSSMGLKHFLPFSLEASRALNLLPTFSSMDPVQKTVLHHTLGISPSSKRKYVSCNVCQLRFNSQSQALSHYKGTKHAKKLKSLEMPKCKQKSSAVMREKRKEPEKDLSPSAPAGSTEKKEAIPDPLHPVVPSSPAKCGSSVASSEAEFTSAEGQSPDVTPGAAQDPEAEKETEEGKALRLLYCSLCKVAVNSASQLEAHNSGTKHKTMLEARTGSGSIKSFPRTGVKNKLLSPTVVSTGLQNKTFHCETCDVHVNSETQLKQHISSRRHKDRTAGKPAKPKYSPYTKSAKGPTKQQIGIAPVKLPLSKDMTHPLSTAIVPSHLGAIAAAAAAAIFPLRISHKPSFFQTHSLPTTLLRPAPGPIRTSHAPVLFAPY